MPSHPHTVLSLSGRLFLSQVQLVSARPGPGERAGWVEECTCPPGYTSQFCQSCAPGFTREIPFGSPFVTCVPCACNQHGDCHPLTGGHLSSCPATACVSDKSVSLLVCEGYWKPSCDTQSLQVELLGWLEGLGS